MAIYNFAPGPEHNSYIFPTNLGWLYTVRFRESADYFNNNEVLYNNALVFEICFSRLLLNPVAAKKRYDPIVKETIHAILYHHLEGRGNIPFYIFICYAADAKEAARLNLFSNWFDTFETANWLLYSYELSDADAAIYYGLIVNLNHPFASVIPGEFEIFVQKGKNVWKELFRRR